VAGTCECGNEPSGSIKCGEILKYVSAAPINLVSVKDKEKSQRN
jgi:hypothetical protein